MTQKEKIGRAIQMALQVKSIANSLEYDAKDYDVQFPLPYAKRLNELAESYLSIK